MTSTYLHYHPDHGFVHNWLIAGPVSIPVTKLSVYSADGIEPAVLKQYFSPESGVTEPPADLAPLNKDRSLSEQLFWRYHRCAEDHFIDLSSTYPECAYLKAWAYVELDLAEDSQSTFTITSNGPADLWLNGSHLHRQDTISRPRPSSTSFPVSLQSGRNTLLLRMEMVARRETPFVLAVHLDGLSDEAVEVMVPTDIEELYLELRQAFEEVIQSGYLDRYVFGRFGGDLYDKNEPITVRFAPELKIIHAIPLTYRLQSHNEDIYQEGNQDTDNSMVYELAKNYPLRSGAHELALLPEATLYYQRKIQLTRRDNFYVVRSPYSPGFYGTFRQRQREALEDAAKRPSESLFTEIARMALRQYDQLDLKIIRRSFERIDRRQDGCIADLLGLLGAWLRFRGHARFPLSVIPAIELRLLAFRYWEDEPGEDIMDFTTESRQLLFHTCEILAGQIFSNHRFSNSNQTGLWHREKGERLAMDWLISHGKYGWGDWDSPEGFEEELAALSCLVDFASSPAVSELASVMIDKILFSIAINSVKGCFGSTHRHSATADLLSARLNAASGISRVMWGMGNFTIHLLGSVSLGLMRNYQLPAPVKNIAISPQVVWNRERHEYSALDEVNKVTFKSGETLLCSAQNYHPYSPGKDEHIWQATLGPDAVVFVNHPACMSEEDAHRPNFWNGNAILPQVVQWGDMLIARYRLPDDDWLGFTHAYFPTTTFDAYQLDGHWAFASKGNGYLALYSSRPFKLIKRGQSAYRELRAYGKEAVWICAMGQSGLDGSFEEFQQRIKALDLTVNRKTIRLRSWRGDEIVFGKDARLMINGQEQAISGYRHYESPYCIADFPAEQMDIGFDRQAIRLRFTS